MCETHRGVEHEADHTEPEGQWIKRINWCACMPPFNSYLESITSMVCEGNLAFFEAIAEIENTVKLLQMFEKTPLSTPEQRDVLKREVQAVRDDLKIAVSFIVEAQVLDTPGVHSRRLLLDRLVTEKRIDPEKSK